MRAPRTLDPALAQAALQQREIRPGLALHQQRAEVDSRVRVVAVERGVDLARALAADQRPVGGVRWAGVEEVDRARRAQGPRTGTGTGSAPPGARAASSRRSIGDEVELERRQVLVVLEHRPRHVEQLRRMRRDDLDDADAQRRGREDEVDVLEAALDDRDSALGLARRARAGVALPVSTDGSTHERHLVRTGQHPRVADADEDLVAVVALELHERPLVAAHGDDELRPPVHPPRAHVPPAARRRRAGASCTLTPRYGRAMKFGRSRSRAAAAAIPHSIAAPELAPQRESARARAGRDPRPRRGPPAAPPPPAPAARRARRSAGTRARAASSAAPSSATGSPVACRHAAKPASTSSPAGVSPAPRPASARDRRSERRHGGARASPSWSSRAARRGLERGGERQPPAGGERRRDERELRLARAA